MGKRAIDLTLYLVTDRMGLHGDMLAHRVEQAIQGGVTLVQLREKQGSTREFLRQARLVKEVTDHYGIPLLINDRLDIALAVEADGIHLGQDDLPANVARRILGPDKIIGVSVTRLDEAIRAQEDEADYLGVGAVFPTGTKNDAVMVSMEEMRRITAGVRIPVVAIGGIQEHNVAELQGYGLAGVAVVSAILGRSDAKNAAMEMQKAVRGIM